MYKNNIIYDLKMSTRALFYVMFHDMVLRLKFMMTQVQLLKNIFLVLENMKGIQIECSLEVSYGSCNFNSIRYLLLVAVVLSHSYHFHNFEVDFRLENKIIKDSF